MQFSNKDLKIVLEGFSGDNWNACIIRFEQLYESSIWNRLNLHEVFMVNEVIISWLLWSIER